MDGCDCVSIALIWGQSLLMLFFDLGLFQKEIDKEKQRHNNEGNEICKIKKLTNDAAVATGYRYTN